MYAVGSSEIVQDELLSLFCCDDGHQMWLTNYDEQRNKKLDKKKTVLKPTISNKGISLLVQNTEKKIKIDKSVKPVKVIKKETVLKKASNNNNYSSSINIKKFGVETLLHKKMESDRLFTEGLENEKSELLHLMLTQKKLFERTKKKKLSISSIILFEKRTSIVIYTLAILAIYTII